jgi:hypothetical protein
MDEPASTPGSIAQRLHHIRQAKELLASHEHEELYLKRSVRVSIFYDHLEEVLNAYRTDLLIAVKAGALATSTPGACAFLANRQTNYNVDLMQLYAFVEKAEEDFPALLKQPVVSIK